MVGEDPEKTHSLMRITRTPDSLPSFLGDLVRNLIENLDTRLIKAPTGKRVFNYRFLPFSANSDHFLFNDGAVGVPMMMFNSSPDEFHHTNLDTPDQLDMTELKRTACLAAGWALSVASARRSRCLCPRSSRSDVAVCGRIAQSVQKGSSLLRASEDRALTENLKAGRDYIKFTAKRERGAVLSCERLCRDEGIKKGIRLLLSSIDQVERETTSHLRKFLSRTVPGQKARAPRTGLERQREGSRLARATEKGFFL